MADLNKCFIMGRLTFDPELRRTGSGKAVTELRLATSKKWKDRDGQQKEDTLFIGVTCWDKLAENCCQYLRKGSSVHVEGSLKMDSWDDKTTGEKKTKIGVLAESVQFLDGKPRDNGGSNPDSDITPERYPKAAEAVRQYEEKRRPDPKPIQREYAGTQEEDDGIPF